MFTYLRTQLSNEQIPAYGQESSQEVKRLTGKTNKKELKHKHKQPTNVYNKDTKRLKLSLPT